MLALANEVLQPYAEQKNTGNCYEFFVALSLLRKMGLTDYDLSGLQQTVEAIAQKNSRSARKITAAYASVRAQPVGVGLFLGGQQVERIRNVTQNDGDGGTGDLVLLFADGTEKSISICEGTRKKDGRIEKCLSNPTCKRFGCTEEDVLLFQRIASDTVPAYTEEMRRNYGVDETLWRRKPSKAACDATSAVAEITAARFNASERKSEIMKDLLRVSTDAGSKPADFLCVVNEKCSAYHLFEIGQMKEMGAPSLVADTYWLKMYLGDTYIGRTQVKFNNGVYHNGKTSSLTSSWNASVLMNTVFDLVGVPM
jgi:hypothetical protein